MQMTRTASLQRHSLTKMGLVFTTRRLCVKPGAFAMFRLVCCAFLLASFLMSAHALDLKIASVVAPANLSAQEKKAVLMLVEEAAKRTHIRWPETTSWPASSERAVIAVGPKSALS